MQPETPRTGSSNELDLGLGHFLLGSKGSLAFIFNISIYAANYKNYIVELTDFISFSLGAW